VLENVTKGSC